MNRWSPETYVLLSVVLSAIPIAIGVGTCYLKFSIVLSLLKSGFGTQQAPSAALVMALSIVMSLVVMQPVLVDTFDQFQRMKISDLSTLTVSQLLERGTSILKPWKEFLLKHCGKRELFVFSRLSSSGAPVSHTTDPGRRAQLPTSDDTEGAIDERSVTMPTILGAFVVSEIKSAFLLAFLMLIPFFVIDLIVANVLVGLGLTMMSPVIVSLPLKLLLFITSDGWLLMAKSLVRAYQ